MAGGNLAGYVYARIISTVTEVGRGFSHIISAGSASGHVDSTGKLPIWGGGGGHLVGAVCQDIIPRSYPLPPREKSHRAITGGHDK